MAQGMFDYWDTKDPRTLQEEYMRSIIGDKASEGSRWGAQIGTSLGRLFGGTTPLEAEQNLIKDVFSQAAKATNDPMERMKIAAQGFREKGMEGRAMQLEEQMAKIAAAQAKATEVDPTQKLIEGAKYTPASIAKYRKTGNVEDLMLVEKDKPLSYGTDAEIVSKAMFGKQFAELSAQEADAVRREMERVGVTKAKAGATNVSQVVTNKAAEQFGSKFGQLSGEQAAQIEGKYQALDYIKEAKDMLSKGIYAGQWGPEKMLLAKSTGGLIGDQSKVENTEQFLAYLGNVVIPRLQEFGGNDSVEELKYLRSVAAGDQRLEPGSMKQILDRSERAINRGIERVKRQTAAVGAPSNIPLDAGPGRNAPKPTMRFNPQTGKLEKVQ